MARSYAVFDIDGTLIRWQLFHALADTLAKNGAIDLNSYQSVLGARRNWKGRGSLNSYVDYEKSLIELIDNSLSEIKYETFVNACSAVFSQYQDQVYTFTRDLIAELKRQGYLIFAVSTSPQELVEKVTSYYHFDDCAGTNYEVKDGRLTGRKRLLIGEAKANCLTKLIDKHQAEQEGSFAIGDTENDFSMLKIADHPIAFNPTKEFFSLAQKEGWDIVIERKNMIYQLKYIHGKYILAPTIGPTIIW